MSYDAKVFNVMIASPGDVKSERAIIRDVIYEWNAVNSKSRNIVLLPVGWETHSSPEMGASPQDIINQQILDKCDFLIGVFWTRIGTPTTEYESGTVEEIRKHIALEKPAMLYFSSQPVAMESVDLEQYTELKKFQESCKNDGLYEGYDDLTDFRNKVYRHLQLKLNEHSYFKEINSESISEIVESKNKFPKISNDAKTLLKEASLDKNGAIFYLRHLNGTNLETNGKDFISSNERRIIASWESALQELVEAELVEDKGYKGELFELTNYGYQVADMIEL